MLMKTLFDTYRDISRHLVPGQQVTTVPVVQPAANASRWTRRSIDSEAQGRRMRRQRRMDRAANRPIAGWTVRTW